jgi:hypothetical protein
MHSTIRMSKEKKPGSGVTATMPRLQIGMSLFRYETSR